MFDRDSLFELGARYGRSLITALARLDGRPVGVLCSDPSHYAGGLTADASEKLTRFVDVCDQFRLPVVNFVDQPGFVIGTEAERRGTIRRGTRALTAVYQASVPWASILVRKVYGVAGAAHGHAARLNLRYAWPSGDWGSLPIEGGIEAAYRRELEAADDPVALRAEIEERLNAVRSPVPDRGALHGRGDHRPARHAAAAVRVGGTGAGQDVGQKGRPSLAEVARTSGRVTVDRAPPNRGVISADCSYLRLYTANTGV